MADGPDRRGSANGDAKQDGTDDSGGAEDAEQQADTPAAAPDEEPRRLRLYGYDPDLWPELG
jgi:hypothetical protein